MLGLVSSGKYRYTLIFTDRLLQLLRCVSLFTRTRHVVPSFTLRCFIHLIFYVSPLHTGGNNL